MSQYVGDLINYLTTSIIQCKSNAQMSVALERFDFSSYFIYVTLVGIVTISYVCIATCIAIS